jgi:hypothetical protein
MQEEIEEMKPEDLNKILGYFTLNLRTKMEGTTNRIASE